MRLLSLGCFLLFFTALVLSSWLPDPVWELALYFVPLFASLLAVSLLAVLMELYVGEHFRGVAPFMGVALVLVSALYAAFERAPGTLPESLPLDILPEKAISIAMLGAALGGATLGWAGLSAPLLASQVLGGLACLGGAAVLGVSARAIGIPFVSPLSLVIFALSLTLYTVSVHRERKAKLAELEKEQPPSPS